MFAIIAFIPIIVTIIDACRILLACKNRSASGVAHYSRCMLLRMADGLHYNCSAHCIRIPYIH